MAKQNYDKTNYIKHVKMLDLNYPEKNLGGPGQDLGEGLCPPGANVEPLFVLDLIPLFMAKLIYKLYFAMTAAT